MASPKILRTSRDFETFSSSSAAEPSAKSFKSERERHIESTLNVLSKKGIIGSHTIGERKILQKGCRVPLPGRIKVQLPDGETSVSSRTSNRRTLAICRGRQSSRAKFYVPEPILALEHLHKYDIVYRDLWITRMMLGCGEAFENVSKLAGWLPNKFWPGFDFGGIFIPVAAPMEGLGCQMSKELQRES